MGVALASDRAERCVAGEVGVRARWDWVMLWMGLVVEELLKWNRAGGLRRSDIEMLASASMLISKPQSSSNGSLLKLRGRVDCLDWTTHFKDNSFPPFSTQSALLLLTNPNICINRNLSPTPKHATSSPSSWPYRVYRSHTHNSLIRTASIVSYRLSSSISIITERRLSHAFVGS